MTDNDFVWGHDNEPYEWARTIAHRLLQSPHVEQVLLFGSLALGKATKKSDIDLIVIVDVELSQLWHQEVLDADSFDMYTIRRHLRLEYAGDIVQWYPFSVPFDALDIFLFPPDWREQLAELQRLGKHADPSFMENIARDATAYDPALGSFPMADLYRRRH